MSLLVAQSGCRSLRLAWRSWAALVSVLARRPAILREVAPWGEAEEMPEVVPMEVVALAVVAMAVVAMVVVVAM